ncbi:MAG TPA: hypothetical protein VGG33_01500 [Polyangia bacterium]
MSMRHLGGEVVIERQPKQSWLQPMFLGISNKEANDHADESELSNMRHLRPGGVIAFQATNRFIDIGHVVASLGAEFGLTTLLVEHSPPTDRPNPQVLSTTQHLLATANQSLLASPRLREVAVTLQPRPTSHFRIVEPAPENSRINTTEG